MKKIVLPLILVILVGLLGVIIVRFVLNGGEDTWVCQNNEWVKHGNPSSPKPQTGCGNGAVSQNDSPTKIPEVSTVNAIIGEFGKKYKRPVDAFIVDISVDTGSFAKGSVKFYGEQGGGLWFGAKTEKGWELVADGQGPMSCEVANKYNMPKDLVPECIDVQNNSNLVQR